MPNPRHLAATVLLLIITCAAYAPLWNNGFVNYDDEVYITQNRAVQQGLSADTMVWAFTSTQAGNWHPLTWISHALDYYLWGQNPRGHHLTGLAIHILNTLLLLQVLLAMTAGFWPAFFAAAVFALHPLNVESVAWAAERKTLLCGFFWMLTILAYLRYVRFPSGRAYFWMVLSFILGLLSKPMMVTLPFALLLLDFWPLGRTDFWTKRVKEKCLLFVIAAGSCAITVMAQRPGDVATGAEGIQLFTRIANAFLEYATYLVQMAWPAKMAMFYPYPSRVPPIWIAALSLILGITWGVLAWRKKAPYLLLGWLWFLGTLVPVIGLVQVGEQARADRYMYLPMIGLAVALVWSVKSLIQRNPKVIQAAAPAGCLVLGALGFLTYQQSAVWRDNYALFSHALQVNKQNYVAHINYARVLRQGGRVLESDAHVAFAIKGMESALPLFPGHVLLYQNLGTAYAMTGKYSQAAKTLETGLRLRPDDYLSHYILGYSLLKLNREHEAKNHFLQALRIAPQDPVLRENIDAALRGK